MKKTVVQENNFISDLSGVLLGLSPQQHLEKRKEAREEIGIWPIFDSTNAYRRILEAIDSSRQTLLLSSFLISDEKLEASLLRAADRGVRVYLLTASDTILRKTERDEIREHDQEMIKSHIKMLNNFVGRILCRTAEHLHAKFLLIDPVVNNSFNKYCTLFVSTANFTTKALKVNPEIIVEISEQLGYPVQILKDAYAFFLYGFWNEATHELLEKGRWSAVNQSPTRLKEVSLKGCSVTLNKKNSKSPEITSLKRKIDDYIDDLQDADEAVISVYTLDINHEIVKRLLASNFSVTVLTRYRNANFPFFEGIKNPRLRCFTHDSIHAKFIVYRKGERYYGIVFTANFSEKGMDEGYEIGIDLPALQAKYLLSIANSWINSMKLEYISHLKNSDIIQRVKSGKISLHSGHADVRVSTKKENRDLVKCKTFDEYVNYKSFSKNISKIPKDDLPNLYLQKSVIMDVYAPALPEKYKTKENPVSLNGKEYTVYTSKREDQRYVRVSSIEEYFLIKKEAEKNKLIVVS